MKTKPKKAHRNFRIASEIDSELIIRSKETGIPQTRILEDALRCYFKKTMKKLLGDQMAAWKGVQVGGAGTPPVCGQLEQFA